MRGLINFFKRPTGQFVAIALFIAGVSYAARLVYVDQPKAEEEALARSGRDRIGELANVLIEQASAAQDQDAYLNGLPTRTAWFPADLPCGASTRISSDPFWNGLGLKPGEASAYQYRFERDTGSFVIRTRRDRDCDGLYVVHHVNGTITWPRGFVGAVESQNIGE
ncbi:MAG: hypothetical protein R3E66_21560 [bacterium]